MRFSGKLDGAVGSRSRACLLGVDGKRGDGGREVSTGN